MPAHRGAGARRALVRLRRAAGHVISDAVGGRVLELLDSPVLSPYGNPIPALEELGRPAAPAASASASPAVLVTPTAWRPSASPEISELVQGDADLLALLVGAGVRPGARVRPS